MWQNASHFQTSAGVKGLRGLMTLRAKPAVSAGRVRRQPVYDDLIMLALLPRTRTQDSLPCGQLLGLFLLQHLAKGEISRRHR
mmetsp:Transcript_21602/g.48860  ORF Transcript_21602/g.48860 Transcript_21602/m.48860 type:complete len:83 (+) Transcript_21602:1162-1410(+)